MLGHIIPVHSIPNLAHTVVDGRYYLESVIGRGGYSVVYRAKGVISPSDTSTPFYAIKVLAKMGLDSRHIVRLRDEVRIHDALSHHRNIVTFYGQIETVEFMYLVTELCPTDLFNVISTRNVFYRNDELLKATFIQVIGAVEYCHVNGVYHRDIKSENILCNTHGTDIRLTDFGLATTRERETRFGMGSLYAMSPECINVPAKVKDYSTSHSDIWSLGILLHTMMTQRRPWNVATINQPLFAAFTCDPTGHFLRTIPVSGDAEGLLSELLRLDPELRMSLSELRRQVAIVPTFFVTEDILPGPNSSLIVSEADERNWKGFKPAESRALVKPSPARRSSKFLSSVVTLAPIIESEDSRTLASLENTAKLDASESSLVSLPNDKVGLDHLIQDLSDNLVLHAKSPASDSGSDSACSNSSGTASPGSASESEGTMPCTPPEETPEVLTLKTADAHLDTLLHRRSDIVTDALNAGER